MLLVVSLLLLIVLIYGMINGHELIVLDIIPLIILSVNIYLLTRPKVSELFN